MIYTLTSTDPRFKTLTFRRGLNVLVAHQHEHATAADTRNGVGKSSLIVLLHHLLGGTAGKRSIFLTEALAESTFTLDFDLGRRRLSVSRSGVGSGVLLTSEDPVGPCDQLFGDDTQSERLKLKQWQALLRKELFSLVEAGGPSSRSLLSYFCRRVDSGGFHDPFKNHYRQSPCDSQVAISFLLDLDWCIAEAWDDVRKREKTIRTLSSALKEGQLGAFEIGSVAKLRTRVALAENRVAALRRSIENFRVVDAFADLEQEANGLTTKIRQLSDDNAIDLALIDQLQLTYESEEPPAADDLEALYEAAGVQLRGLVRRRFREVAAFHESVIRNRARHLQEETNRAEQRVREREAEQQRLDSRRADLFRILRSGGALSELMGLQEQLVYEQTQVEGLRSSYQIADEIASGKAGVKRARQNLLVELQQDQREREAQLREIIGGFEEFSSRLYGEREGSLEIGFSDNGPTFDIAIEAGESKGIGNMKVFCFDLLVSQICAQRSLGPGFLVHDSHIFDGVDERQIGHGLALAHEVATEHGFQYIVTINSDNIPTTFPDGFSLEDHMMDVQLTDSFEEGGLFGFRF